jgi:hypothetical protein
MRLLFQAFKAINHQEYCERFLEGHVRVLEDYGITNISTNNRKWMTMDSVYVIIALTEDKKEIVGGIRIHIANEEEPLPIEKAVGSMDARVHHLINQYREEGTGELCGLWNAKSVAGYGVSLLLVRAGISLVNQVQIESLFTICGDYTLPMVNRVGFIVERSIGQNGEFLYPKENYIARVLRKMNAVTLETAEEYDRGRIIDLRENPVQTTEEIGPKGPLTIEYNLLLSN